MTQSGHPRLGPTDFVRRTSFAMSVVGPKRTLPHLRATVLAGLFVIADAAALVANFCNKGLFRNRLGRSGLREVIVHREDTSP
jgi:hypothetical protein